MNDWLTSSKRKRHQRAINKLIRELNKNIENDTWWKGRFYIRQEYASWQEYEDRSGAELWVVLRLYDRKTNATKVVADYVNHLRFPNGVRLWSAMNDFIVKDCIFKREGIY